ncbi:MAG: tetratricopeptide repeat protein [Syntrophorhabdaceae bacterium]|nr:tetratricopeptide repeat protein [Syntrophorhabdaceae bacterium]
MKKNIPFMLSIIVFIAFVFSSSIVSAETALDKGIKEFNEENYEEAVKYFENARKADPKSTMAAFYLGLTYKILEDPASAIPHLRDAVTMEPKIKEALVELIDVLIQTDKFEEAKKWIEVAEKEQIYPARVQFLKGTNLMKENKNNEAIVAFEKAKELDKTLAQAADFQIANAYMRLGNLKESRKRFQALITIDPKSDLAGYARDYENAITEKLDAERPFRLTVGLGYKYDSNVNARPTTGTIFDNPNFSSFVSGQEDYFINATLRAVYIAPFSFKKPYNLAVQYYLYLDRYMRRDDYNLAQHSLSIAPGYSFSRVALSLPFIFGYINLQREKGDDFLNKLDWWEDTKYQKSAGVNPTMRYMVNDKNILELSYGFMINKYYTTTDNTAPRDPNEDRDGRSNSGSIGWMYLFKDGNGLLALRYTYSVNETDGRNWTYNENRFNLSFIYPLTKNFKFQFTSDAAFAKYRYDNTTFNIKRRNDTFINSVSLTYSLTKNMDIIGQYTYTRDNCNISTYDYKRSVAGINIEYRL